MGVLESLYNAYHQWFQSQEQLAVQSGVRELLGYSGTAMEPEMLSRERFAAWLTGPWESSSAKQEWINRWRKAIGTSVEAIPDDVESFLADCSGAVPPCLIEEKRNSESKIRAPHFRHSSTRSQQHTE